MLYVGRLQTAHGTRVRHKIRILVRHKRDARLEAGRVQCMRHAREQVRMSEIDKKESYLLTYLPLLRRGRRTGLPRPRRARRALAIAPWARGDAVWHARRPRRAYLLALSLPIAVDASRWAEDAAARVRKNKGLTLPKREHTEGSYGDTPEHSTHVHDRVQHRGRLVADKPGAAAPLGLCTILGNWAGGRETR